VQQNAGSFQARLKLQRGSNATGGTSKDIIGKMNNLLDEEEIKEINELIKQIDTRGELTLRSQKIGP
jgi:hypothetical protein